jgi:phage host-nuclease inhibitor protein Gam
MAKTKKTTISNVTLEQAQAASETFAVAANQLEKLEAKMNEEIDQVKSKYMDNITEQKNQMNEPVEVLEVFAKEQQESWGKKKSLELLHCIIGFRTGTPKVSKDAKFTWPAITELLKKKSAMFSEFLREISEVNKEAVLSCKDEVKLAMLKEECYISIDQGESFYVTSKKENVA